MVRRYEHVVPSKYKRRLRLPGKPLSNGHLYETAHGHGHRAVLNTTHKKTLNSVPRAERLCLSYTECHVCAVSNATTLPTVKLSRINNISQKYVDGASSHQPHPDTSTSSLDGVYLLCDLTTTVVPIGGVLV